MFGAREVSISPIAPPAWITRAEAKAHLGITGTDNDTKIDELLDVVALQIEAYTGALVRQRTVTERMYPEDPVSALALTHYPIIALASLTIDDVAETLGEIRIANSGGMLRYKDGTQIAGREIVAEYTAGYADNAIPRDLVFAAKEHLKDLYNSIGRDSAVASESVPDVGAVEYRNGDAYFYSNGVAVSAPVAALLARFVRRGV